MATSREEARRDDRAAGRARAPYPAHWEADIALRERTDADEDLMDDESESGDDDASTDFVGVQTAPITVLHMRDNPAIHDDAPYDAPFVPEPEPEPDGAADGAADRDDDTTDWESRP